MNHCSVLRGLRISLIFIHRLLYLFIFGRIVPARRNRRFQMKRNSLARLFIPTERSQVICPKQTRTLGLTSLQFVGKEIFVQSGGKTSRYFRHCERRQWPAFVVQTKAIKRSLWKFEMALSFAANWKFQNRTDWAYSQLLPRVFRESWQINAEFSIWEKSRSKRSSNDERALKESVVVIFAFDGRVNCFRLIFRIPYWNGIKLRFATFVTCVSRLLDCPSEWRELVPFSVSRLPSIQFATDTKFVQVSLLISYRKN